MKIDELMKKGSQYFRDDDRDKVKKERFEAVLETTRHQFENCKFYRQFCKQKNFDPYRGLKSYDDIKDIPYITTANFKQKSGQPKKFLCVPESEIVVWTTSSGTSGDPSMVGRDRITVNRFFDMFQFILDDLNQLGDYKWSLFFQPPARQKLTRQDTIPEPTNHFGYIFNVSNKLDLEDRKYALKPASEEARKQGKMFEFDPETTFSFLSSEKAQSEIGWLSGSIPLIYMSLTEYYKKTGRTFQVDDRSILMSGGGWKTFQGQAVTPDKFRADLNKIIGIPENHIFDVYSFTETDCAFAECEHHNKHNLPWQDIIVRDVETLEPVEIGEEGLMNVINPIAHSYAGVSILQDDIVKIKFEDDCPCGRKGKVLEVVGRAKGAEARGCGAQIADETL